MEAGLIALGRGANCRFGIPPSSRGVRVPELPEVELVLRRISPDIIGRTIRDVALGNSRVIRPHSPARFRSEVRNHRIGKIWRRGKYLVFQLRRGSARADRILLLHLGMTGRVGTGFRELTPQRHMAAIFDLGDASLVFEDPRQFGSLQLDGDVLKSLGPEPLEDSFSPEVLIERAGSSRRAIKVCLLDQACIAGLGNIYAAESLFQSGIHPAREARGLKQSEWERLYQSIREVLSSAIQRGMLGAEGLDSGPTPIFYRSNTGPRGEMLPQPVFQVYDRSGSPCPACGTPVKRILQGGRSTFFCPSCQR